MKSTSNFYSRIRHVLFGVAERVLHDPTSLDSGHGMFDADADLCQLPIDTLFPIRERMALRLFFSLGRFALPVVHSPEIPHPCIR